MAEGRQILGYEMLIELGGGKLGCLTNLTVDLSRDTIETSCRENGNFTGFAKGNLSGTISFDGLYIIDDPRVPTNVRAGDLIDMMLDDSPTPITYVIGPGQGTGGDTNTMGEPGDIPGAKVLSGEAIMSGFSWSGGQDGNATYSGTLSMSKKPTHAVAV